MNGRREIIEYDKDGTNYPVIVHQQKTMGRGLMVDAHYHEGIELIYCQEGRFHMVLDENVYTLKGGDMIVIHSMGMHRIQALSRENNQYIVIRFRPELLYTTVQTIFEMKYVLPFTMKTAVHQKVFQQAEMMGTDMAQLIHQIFEEYQEKSYGFELAIRTALGEIFLWILRKWHREGLNLNLCSGINQGTLLRLEKIFQYVENHYKEAITVEEMSYLCNMSYSYFSRFFKKVMHRNFSDYVNFIRISKSTYLLATSDRTITKIAMEVGFSTSSYFTSQFKRIKGITPRQFRNKFSQAVNGE